MCVVFSQCRWSLDTKSKSLVRFYTNFIIIIVFTKLFTRVVNSREKREPQKSPLTGSHSAMLGATS